MIDCETLGLSMNAAVASIGLVRFSPASGFQKYETLKTNSMRVTLNLADVLKDGFEIDADTLKWWFKQGAEAQASTFGRTDEVHPALACGLIREFLRPDDKIWSNGANFDAPLITGYFDRYNLALPWKYYNVRCYRTVMKLANAHHLNTEVKNQLAHDPVADCIAQVQRLQKIAEINPGYVWN